MDFVTIEYGNEGRKTQIEVAGVEHLQDGLLISLQDYDAWGVPDSLVNGGKGNLTIVSGDDGHEQVVEVEANRTDEGLVMTGEDYNAYIVPVALLGERSPVQQVEGQ